MSEITQLLQDNAQYIVPLIFSILTFAAAYFTMYRGLATKIGKLGMDALAAKSPSSPGGVQVTPDEAEGLVTSVKDIWDEIEKLGGKKPPGTPVVAVGAPSV
jgi:hypothetical protein